MPAELQADARGLQPVRTIERVARFGERHERTSPCEQLRGRDAAARGADHHHATILDREVTVTHAITAASESSG